MDCLNCGDEVQIIDEFRAFPKIARLSRECTITEKIDGTNAQIRIKDGRLVSVGSRNRFLTPDKDNFGFACWAYQHEAELVHLGDGVHYGEWWGLGIQRGYQLFERRFSLFRIPKGSISLPPCVLTVPLLYSGPFDTAVIDTVLNELQTNGSQAAPGFMKPEGIVVYHRAAGVMFKKTIENDTNGKEQQNVAAENTVA